MTTDEAIMVIEAAGDPGIMFGSQPVREYRRLARLTHPDSHSGDPRAAAAFAKLAAFWQRRQAQATGRRRYRRVA